MSVSFPTRPVATGQPPADLPMPQAIVDEETEQMQDACMGLLKTLDEMKAHLPRSIYDYGVRLARAKTPDLKLVDSWDTALGHLRAEMQAKDSERGR